MMHPRHIAAVSMLIIGCAAPIATLRPTSPTVEMQLDDGHASEKPLLGNRAFETLLRFDFAMPAYTPRRLRFLLAQPGKIVFTLYDEAPDGKPGRALASFSRDYDAALVSSGSDGKWVGEELSLPRAAGALWVGVYGESGDARIWASSNASAEYTRDPDPSARLESLRAPRTLMLRLEASPE